MGVSEQVCGMYEKEELGIRGQNMYRIYSEYILESQHMKPPARNLFIGLYWVKQCAKSII